MFKAVWNYFEYFGWGVHHELVDRIEGTLKSHGISRAVALSYPHKKGVAGPLNRFMADLHARDTFFIPFASVYPDDDTFREDADWALDSPHIFGFKFQPLVQGFDINHPRLDYVYGQCVERDIPLIIHIGSGPMANEHVGVAHFKALMKRYPALRVCVPHMGMTEYNDFLVMLDDYPNMYLDTTIINTRTDVCDNTYTGDTKRLLANADRVCFGTDWPLVPYPYQEALDSVARFGFTQGQMDGVFYDNAFSFLRMKAC